MLHKTYVLITITLILWLNHKPVFPHAVHIFIHLIELNDILELYVQRIHFKFFCREVQSVAVTFNNPKLAETSIYSSYPCYNNKDVVDMIHLRLFIW